MRLNILRYTPDQIENSFILKNDLLGLGKASQLNSVLPKPNPLL